MTNSSETDPLTGNVVFADYELSNLYLPEDYIESRLQ